jgi:hypothetical protein
MRKVLRALSANFEARKKANSICTYRLKTDYVRAEKFLNIKSQTDLLRIFFAFGDNSSL